MGGAMDWVALPIIVDVLGVKDPEMLLYQVLLIRDRQVDESEA